MWELLRNGEKGYAGRAQVGCVDKWEEHHFRSKEEGVGVKNSGKEDQEWGGSIWNVNK